MYDDMERECDDMHRKAVENLGSGVRWDLDREDLKQAGYFCSH